MCFCALCEYTVVTAGSYVCVCVYVAVVCIVCILNVG